MKEISLEGHVQNILGLSRQFLLTHPKATASVGTNPQGETTLAVDSSIEELAIGYLREHRLPASAYSEERGIVPASHERPAYLFALDPNDGTANYAIDEGDGIMPHGPLLAFMRGTSPNIGNVAAAGALEFSRKQQWIFDGRTTNVANLQPVDITSRHWKLQADTPIQVDTHFIEGYDAYRPLVGRAGRLRDTGSTIGNLSLVLSGKAAVMLGAFMKPEEVPAVYGLIRGAGGVVVDFAGRDVGEMPFDPERKYQILAGNSEYVQEALSVLAA